MPLVIAGGQSVQDYPKEEVVKLASCAFTFGVNGAIFDYPCDVVVTMDPLSRYPKIVEEIKRQNKVVICREYPGNDKLGVDLIEVPNNLINKYPLSGMAAAKLSDILVNKCEGRSSYVLGIDATKGNYKGYKTGIEVDNDPHDREDLIKYEQLGLTKTINLSVHSRVSCWPKLSKLPHIRKVMVNLEYKLLIMAWIKGEGVKLL